jgi:sugar (pentulose or hexulose) kinase
MLIYSVDLGTTNLKVALFDEQLRRLSLQQTPALYDQARGRVEFNAEAHFGSIVELINRCATESGLATGAHSAVIALTGQAESFVLTGPEGRSIRPAISWLDERAVAECAEIEKEFSASGAFRITGEPMASPVWPASKLRWLSKHESSELASASHIFMLKDYVQFRLTGVACGEISTRGFSYLFDVQNKRYWDDMVAFSGASLRQLPEIVAPGTVIGAVSRELASDLPPAEKYSVSVGALDHFCSMVGTGSYRPNIMNESAGTVLSISMLTDQWSFDESRRISFHRGIKEDDIVLFSAVDSGGISLEWYRTAIAPQCSHKELERKLNARTFDNAPIFLPYLTGLNAPDYFAGARAAFLDLTLAHDNVDLAYAVQEGVAHILRRNIEHCATSGHPSGIVSSGGGAQSAHWSQLKANVCNLPVQVPDEREAACRGAAVLALVALGAITRLDEANELCGPAFKSYEPTAGNGIREDRYKRFTNAIEILYR